MIRQLRVPTNPTTLKTIGKLAPSVEEELREEYESFCEGIKKDLDPIEAEYGGHPTFAEWLEAQDA